MKELKDLGRLSLKTNIILTVLKRKQKTNKEASDNVFDVSEARAKRVKNMTKMCGKPLKGVKEEKINWTDCRAYLYTPKQIIDDEWTMLYLHGGAYIASDIDIYSGFVSRLCNSLQIKAYSFDYPLAPEQPYPFGLEAVIEFYKQMIANGHNPAKCIIAGDSAGGGLALAAIKKIQKEKICPAPGMVVLFSPWVDLTMSGKTIQTNIKTDYMITQNLLKKASSLYCGSHNRKTPGISPVFETYENFPPVYILAAAGELLCSECEMLHDALMKHNVDVYLTLWAKAQHAFIVGMHLFPESKQVMQNVKEFIYSRGKINSNKKE